MVRCYPGHYYWGFFKVFIAISREFHTINIVSDSTLNSPKYAAKKTNEITFRCNLNVVVLYIVIYNIDI